MPRRTARGSSDPRDRSPETRPTRRQVLGATAATGLSGLAGCWSGADGGSVDLEDAESSFDSFVGVDGTDFVVDGEPLDLRGGNHPQLRKQSREEQAAWFDQWLDAVPSLNVLRATAWGTGTDRTTDPLQPEPGEHAEEGFRKLDRLVALAGQRGVRLVLPLTNYWDWQGGIPQYVEWSDDAETKADFYTDDQCQDWYRTHVETVLTRENSITGVEYRDDPTIAMWEHCNEPEGGEDFLAWVRDTAELLHDLDPNHLVSTGMAGPVESTDLAERAHDFDAVDAYSLHVWADANHTGIGVDGGVDVLRDNAAAARELGLPIYAGEFGWFVNREDDVPDGEEIERRNRVFRAYLLAMREEDYAGSLVWDLRHDDEYPLDWNRYGVFPRDPGTAAVVASHSESFADPPTDEQLVEVSTPDLSVDGADAGSRKTAVVPETGGGPPDEPTISLAPEGDTYVDPDGDGDVTDPSDLSAEVYLGYGDDALSLRIEVADDTHVGRSGGSLWRADSVQWAVGHAGRYGPEYGCSRTDGEASLYRWFDGDAPAGIGAIDAETRRSGSTTTYDMTVPWRALFPDPPAAGDSFPFGVLVNDVDEAGRDGREDVLGWTLPGVNDEKTPGALGLVVLGGSGSLWSASGSEGPYLVSLGRLRTWRYRLVNFAEAAVSLEVAVEGTDASRTVEVPPDAATDIDLERAFGRPGSATLAVTVTEPESGESRRIERPVMVVRD